jgi:cytochrome c peroxidase
MQRYLMSLFHPHKPDITFTCQSRVPLFFGACLILLAADSSAGDEKPVGSDYPWHERAISTHVSQKEFSGSLGQHQLEQLTAHGEQLFSARFSGADGVGRPMSTQAIIPTKRKRPPRNSFARTSGLDANACAGCHNQPLVGGAGDFVANVFVSEGFQNTDFDNTDPQFSNERNTNHLFGAGLIELLAREMTADLQQQRQSALATARTNATAQTIALQSKGVDFGELTAHADGTVDLSQLAGVDADLVIRPFSQKGVITSLRQFTINALNHHHGMLATERYGARWTGSDDFDEDAISDEITDGDVTALVAWQATLPAPTIYQPENVQWQQAASVGQVLFDDIGCASCHRPALPLRSTVFHDPGPYDAAGTRRATEDPHGTSYDMAMLPWVAALPRNADGDLLVPLYGDLKRHKIADATVATLGNELLAQRFVERDVFATTELWGIAATAPYGHRGDLGTLHEVISAHGGDARAARDRYVELVEREQQSLIAFLKTLTIPADVTAN